MKLGMIKEAEEVSEILLQTVKLEGNSVREKFFTDSIIDDLKKAKD